MIRSIILFVAANVALTAAFALPARAQDTLPRPEQTFKGHCHVNFCRAIGRHELKASVRIAR
jgi:hypothetical protein